MSVALRPRGGKRLARFAALITAAALAVPAVASAATCPVRPTTTPFAQWGDTGNYSLVPGGDFESALPASGWTVTHARETPGNEPFHVDGPSDSSALTMDSGSVATSPAFCIDDSMQSFRFFARALGSKGDLRLSLIVQTAHGRVEVPSSQLLDLTAGTMTTWAPSPAASIPERSVLPSGETGLAQLVFHDTGATSWQIDDIYVDPFRML